MYLKQCLEKVLYAFIRKEERSQISDLAFNFKKLEKQ